MAGVKCSIYQVLHLNMALNIKCGPFSLQNDNEEMPYEAEVMHFQKSFEEIVKQDCKSSKDNLVMKILCFDIP